MCNVMMLPAAGAVLAAATSSASALGSRCRLATTGWCGGKGKATGKTDTAETTKETETRS
jgi:hypothetical protein